MKSKKNGKFKAIESFGIKRRNEFYIIGELIEGAIKKDWFVLIPFNNTISMTVRIKEIEEVTISGEDKKYTLLITSTELEDSFDFILGMKVGNEDLLISEIGED